MTAQKSTTSNLNSQTRSNYYTTDEVAELLKVHRETIRRWIVSGKLHAIQLPSERGSYRISEQDYEKFLKEHYSK